MNEQQLIQSIINDDQRAFQNFVKLYFVRLFNLAHKILRDRQYAEEVVEDVFLQCWTRRHQLSEISNIPAYLYITTKNHSINFLKKQKKPLKDFYDDVDLIDPERHMLIDELIMLMKDTVEKLPPKCREVFVAVKEEGLTYKEAAAKLKLAEKTVEAHMHNALKKVSLALKGYLILKDHKLIISR